MKKSSNIPATARAAIAALMMVACIYGWQMWADSGKRQMQASRSQVSADSLMNVGQPADLPNQIVDYEGFRVSFNPELHIPNWVAWELTADEASGTIPRENAFYNDSKVQGCPEPYDYSYSGYDRGHMCPAGDMKWSKSAMHDTFSLANICPQSKTLNTGAWKHLEEKCRVWVELDSALIIVCGPVLTDPLREAIGDSRVAVPRRFFKVILAPHAQPMRAIGFIMNNGRVEGGMQQAAVSVDEVETVTGLDFFASLPDSIENIVEAQCDFPFWSTLRPNKKKK